MDSLTLLIIAIGLSLDNFAVTIALCTSLKRIKKRQVLRLAVTFTTFHVVMLFIGFFLGSELIEIVENVDHWIAFGLLLFVGVRMIVSSLREEDSYSRKKNPTRGKELLLMGLATSIDALAIGLSFAPLHIGLYMPALVIGIFIFSFTILGVKVGPILGNRAGRYAETFGGVILVLLGLKVLFEHSLGW
jgi:putative Mn2+ efflux pump MntP